MTLAQYDEARSRVFNTLAAGKPWPRAYRVAKQELIKAGFADKEGLTPLGKRVQVVMDLCKIDDPLLVEGHLIKYLMLKVEALEPTVHLLAEIDPYRYLNLAKTLAATWTPGTARDFALYRARNSCECGVCGKVLGRNPEAHHVFSRAKVFGEFEHHPGNLAMLRPDCHLSITGDLGGDRDGSREQRIKHTEKMARLRLPPTALDAQGNMASRKDIPGGAWCWKCEKRHPGAPCKGL